MHAFGGIIRTKITYSISDNALSFLLGVGKTCPKAGLFGETGWVPFQMTIKFSILRFRKRIATLDADRLTNQIFCGVNPSQVL